MIIVIVAVGISTTALLTVSIEAVEPSKVNLTMEEGYSLQ